MSEATTTTKLQCDFCFSGKPAKEVIVRHLNLKRGVRKQACPDCIHQLSYDYQVKQVSHE